MHIENSMSLIYTSTRNKIQLQKFEKFRSFQIIAIEGKMRKIMASVKWTDEQQAAIDKKGSNILVAAAAGSGKTAVLVERIIKKIIVDRVDIDKILVVTFTNAAASEMRERILEAIYKKIEENPEDANLQKQIILLNKSSICTIDSFCLDVIRNNFYEIDISANARVADSTEMLLLKQEVLDDMFEDKYISGDKDFLDLIDTYTKYNKDEDLKDFVEGISVYARVSPEHKIRIVRAWQEKENIVAMTGDGVNDAPALKQADIGVAMGVTGSEVAKDAAAMVLTDDNFATIVKAVENGRNLYQHIKNAIQFLLSGNFGAILAVLYAATAGLPVPFAPVHLLFINLLTDSLPAIALGMEPHSKAVMDQKPRPVNESILTKAYLVNIGTEGLCIGIMTMAAFLIGYRGQDAVLASTMAFGTLCMSRLVHGFNCKDDKPVIFSKRFFNNKYLIGAFVLGTVLITGVLTIPGLHAMFKVVTLNMTQLMTVYGLAFLNLPVIQGLKYLKGKTKWN